MNGMQGVESSLLALQNLSAFPNILSSVASFGSLVLLLRKFVHHFTYIDSLVNQAFAVAVGKVLQGYFSALNTVYASVTLRRSSNVDDDIVHSGVTLLELYLHTQELRSQIEALANICNLHCFPLEELSAKAVLHFSNFYRGGDLLTHLYIQLQVADPAHSPLLKFLFLHSCEPYCGFIRSWIFRADISDPYNEFIVDNLPTELGLLPFPNIRDGVAVPCFLKDFSVLVLRAGQQLQVLIKLFELCHSNYEDILPTVGGHFNDHLFRASPLTFSKRQLEAMVTARNSYYQTLQGKFGNMLTKLDFRYQQVLPGGAIPIYFDNIGEGFSSEVLFALSDTLNATSVSDKWNSHLDTDKIDSDHSSTGNFSVLVPSGESECSSLSDSEEQIEIEQLTENYQRLVGHDQNHFSSLNVSTCRPTDNFLQKSTQSDNSHDMEINLLKSSLKNYGLGYSVESYYRKKSPMHVFVPLDTGDSILSKTDRLTDKIWPLGLLNNSSYDDEELSNDWGLSGYDITGKVHREDMEPKNEGVPYCTKMNSTKDCPEKALRRDQLENDFHSSNSFTSQTWKDHYRSNIFSRNPMLTESMLFKPMGRPGQKCSSAYGQSLPCFDFLTVEDPCRVYAEKLASISTHELINNGGSTDSAGEDCGQSKQGNDGDSFLINDARMACPSSPLYSKEQRQVALVSTEGFGARHWESMLSNTSFSRKGSIGEQAGSLSAMFEMPLDFIIEKCLLQEILLQYKYVSKLAIKLLEGFDLHEHFLALRRYYFMELADWADLFVMSLWHQRCCATEAEHTVSALQGILEMSVQKSSCERDPNKDRLYVYAKGNALMPLATSTIGIHSFDFLGLGYRVDWPVSIILTPSALKIYCDIFNFLIKVKLAVYASTDAWRLLKDLMHFISRRSNSKAHEREVGWLNLLIKMRQQVNHFISTLQQYVQSQLSHISWCRFLHNLKYKVKDMMDLEMMHMEYLTESLHICFLSGETRPVASIIENILECALEFRACLTTSTWDEGGLLGKLSRINISQVRTIKQKLDINLKELYLLHLNSPKHGQFGVSCFWGHLNYNEYYTHNS
ncbi:uncharacterized protein LOC126673061 isoform X2 [Mercurialis annua]|nr:uncharacterized protein LOC126673061 isoform X2 [Mercurialis annua]